MRTVLIEFTGGCYGDGDWHAVLSVPDEVDLKKELDAWKTSELHGSFIHWLNANGAVSANVETFEFADIKAAPSEPVSSKEFLAFLKAQEPHFEKAILDYAKRETWWTAPIKPGKWP